MKRIIAACAIAVFSALLAACGSVYDPEPVGIGPDPSELKRSPCACTEMEFERSLPDWFVPETAV